MKTTKITKGLVLMCASHLMLTNGSASSLEVKQALRKEGVFALQQDVSSHLTTLATENNWKINDNGTYRKYSIDPNAKPARKSVSHPANAPTKKPAKGKTVVAVSVATLLKAATSKTLTKGQPGDWEVNSATGGKPKFYSSSFSRDQVRQKYAKEAGVKFVDVRARKVK